MKDKESKDSLVVQNLHLKQMNIEELIYEVRGQNVMIDSDLAMIYEEETKYLKRAVRTHIKRFPDDFMFELTKDEYAALRCKNSTINNTLKIIAGVRCSCSKIRKVCSQGGLTLLVSTQIN